MEEFLDPVAIKKVEQERRVVEIVALARELNEKGEVFPFFGLDPVEYGKMKETDEEFPGFTTPIDELLRRFEAEGIKVVLGKNPESGNVYILPALSNDIEMDSIAPKQLQIGENMSGTLRELISQSRSFVEFIRA
jgi:hypothetical protein